MLILFIMHFCLNFIADVIQLHSPRSETSSQQQEQEDNEPAIIDEASQHVADNPEKL